MANKLTTETFVERARQVHGDKYDYSKVDYTDGISKVCVICKDHGPFYVSAKTHLVGRGCLECAKQTLWDYDSCLAEAKKYDSENKFKRGSQRAYGIAKRNGWIVNYTWFSVLWSPKWNYNTCYKEAKKYKSRSEFKKACPQGYTAARSNKWLDDYIWFVPLCKQNGYWTKERCKEAALQCSYVTSFQKEQSGAYNAAKKNGWLKDYDWFVSPQKPLGYWCRENCYKEAQKYTRAVDFQKNCSAAFNKAYINGWLTDYIWFVTEKKPNGYWTAERCEEESYKYTSRKEFQKSCPSAYHVSRENKWLDSYVWLTNERINIKGNVDSVYAYFFEETHSVYIGRTLMRRQNNRDKEHLFADGNDVVAIHAKSLGVPVPPMIILEENLTLKDGLEKEDYWRKHFEEEGYNILNRAATGVGAGSLGTIDQGKWNHDACFAEAKKYKKMKDFRSKSASAYASALRNNWLEEYAWLIRERTNTWNEETCYVEAKKYSKMSDFRKNAPGAYNSSKRNCWLNSYEWLEKGNSKPSGYWTYERCKEEAKKYSGRKSFQKSNSSAYNSAYRNGWLDQWDWLSPKYSPAGYWNRASCNEAAKNYHRTTEFARNCVTAYELSRKHGWIKDYVWFEKPFEWTYNLCKSEASKYDTRGHFKAGCTGAYQKSRKQGWLDDFFPEESKER